MDRESATASNRMRSAGCVRSSAACRPVGKIRPATGASSAVADLRIFRSRLLRSHVFRKTRGQLHPPPNLATQVRVVAFIRAAILIG